MALGTIYLPRAMKNSFTNQIDQIIMNKSLKTLPLSFLFILFFTSSFLNAQTEGVPKKSSATPILETGTVTDKDGQTYETIKLFGFEWLRENLNYQTSKSWCFDEVNSYCEKYGRLYLWKSAKKACKALGKGWRLPTDGEWKLLAREFGGYHDWGTFIDHGDPDKAAKALSKDGVSGFGILLAGRRLSSSFSWLGSHASFWSSSETGVNRAVMFVIDSQGFGRMPQSPIIYGTSCRCIRDL